MKRHSKKIYIALVAVFVTIFMISSSTALMPIETQNTEAEYEEKNFQIEENSFNIGIGVVTAENFYFSRSLIPFRHNKFIPGFILFNKIETNKGGSLSVRGQNTNSVSFLIFYGIWDMNPGSTLHKSTLLGIAITW